MDTGKGYFEVVDGETLSDIETDLKLLQEKHVHHGGTFRVGEVIEIRNSIFEVLSFKKPIGSNKKPKELRLKLIRKDKM